MDIEQRFETGLAEQLTLAGFQPVGRMRTRTARDIAGSPWSIGCETLDRGYVDFGQVGRHLLELGAKQVRLQAGWAKCDPHGDGRFEWEWLDAIVDGCVAQGVQPWLQTSYGNPAIEGGGGIGLAEGSPQSAAALVAWDRWVKTLVERYRDRVKNWEIWNEPDHDKNTTGEDYAEFFIRTASQVRAAQPDAGIIGLALAGNQTFARAFLERLSAAGKTELITEVTFHFYPHNPDDAFSEVEQLAQLVKQYAPRATLRQGETGAPSETQPLLALRGHPWSERKQAAWDLRRLIAHHARGIPMSLFQLADMQYTKARGAKFEGRNSKGLLYVHTDKTVAYRKPAYSMAQHVFSLFDNRFPLRALENLAENSTVRSSAHAWSLAGGASPSVVGWWRCDEAPAISDAPLDQLSLPATKMSDPVLLDFLSGTVFELPVAGDALWRELPRADIPLAICERSVLSIIAKGS